jgi:hypothetical protein
MAYVKTEWKARQGENLSKFIKTEESAGSVVLINEPDLITEPGTPFTAGNMNHIEEGIALAHEGVAAEAQARQQGDTGLAQTISNLNKGDIGLGSVTNDAQVKRSEMGAASGVATLNNEGIVPLAQLPEFMSGEGDSEALARAKAYTDEQAAAEARARETADRDLQDQIDFFFTFLFKRSWFETTANDFDAFSGDKIYVYIPANRANGLYSIRGSANGETLSISKTGNVAAGGQFTVTGGAYDVLGPPNQTVRISII